MKITNATLRYEREKLYKRIEISNQYASENIINDILKTLDVK